jgi:hypothetical protein
VPRAHSFQYAIPVRFSALPPPPPPIPTHQQPHTHPPGAHLQDAHYQEEPAPHSHLVLQRRLAARRWAGPGRGRGTRQRADRRAANASSGSCQRQEGGGGARGGWPAPAAGPRPASASPRAAAPAAHSLRTASANMHGPSRRPPPPPPPPRVMPHSAWVKSGLLSCSYCTRSSTVLP